MWKIGVQQTQSTLCYNLNVYKTIHDQILIWETQKANRQSTLAKMEDKEYKHLPYHNNTKTGCINTEPRHM